MNETASLFIGNIPENYDERLGPNIFVDYAEDIARRTAAHAPRRVLELAAGTGIVSRKIRDALAPDASLVVTDLNPPMLEVARGKFRDGEKIEFLQADALALPFDDATFDLLVCQFGVMFFPDKPASYREAMRVLKPGGKYVFNTWGSMAENPFSRIAHNVSAEFFPDNPPGFYKVPFSYGDPDVVVADLRGADIVDVKYDTIPTRKTVVDMAGFARGLVFGNPLIDEIRARGGIDPEHVVTEILAALTKEFGSEPAIMDLKATVFTCGSA